MEKRPRCAYVFINNLNDIIYFLKCLRIYHSTVFEMVRLQMIKNIFDVLQIRQFGNGYHPTGLNYCSEAMCCTW